MSGLQAACEAWRAREEKETAAIVLTDRDLQRVLAAWPMAGRAVVCELPFFAPEAVPEWDALWRCVAVDERGLMELSGLASGRALVAYRRARGLRLIYPDGSLHQVAKMVLQKQLKDALKS